MDTAVIVAFFGLVGTITAAGLGVFVALATNRTEKTKVAENTLEKSLRERIVLRDEIITELKEDLEDCHEEKAAKDVVIQELRAKPEEQVPNG